MGLIWVVERVRVGGRKLTVDHFGASAPAKTIAEKFGYTTANVVKLAKEVLG
jgi:transketolase